METKNNNNPETPTAVQQQTTKKVIVIEVTEDELNNLKAECEKLRNENKQLREDVTINKSLYNYERERNNTLTELMNAVSSICQIFKSNNQ